MRIGMPLGHGDFRTVVHELADYEKAGLDLVLVAEAYGFDSVSKLGYLAAATDLEIGAGILNIYSRTPTLLAMTAAGLDQVSGGRFTLGIGASAPGVVEGFHGLAYDAPLGRTREVVEICRSVWRREKLEFHGEHYDIPRTGATRPLKLIDHPVRERVPVVLAALGPRNVALAAELCEGWEAVFYYPERAAAIYAEPLAEGAAKRSPDLPPLDVVVNTQLGISDDPAVLEGYRRQVREALALYLGGMGARGRNFYNQLAQRYGFPEEARVVEDLFRGGDRAGAAAAVPEELVRGVALIGSAGEVAERVAALVGTGATSLTVVPLAAGHLDRVKDVELLRGLTD